MSGCSFSSDGTVLAVACTSCVALWDPITLKRLGLLSFPVDLDSAHAVSQLEFVHGTDFLVSSPIREELHSWARNIYIYIYTDMRTQNLF